MEDYEKVGLKAGLEIHQQLDTHKLFCSCPSILRNDTENILLKVKRRLNPVTGETGKIDLAAEYEKSKNKIFEYEVFDTNCLVELDESPPNQINQEAVEIAIQISLLFNCKIFPVAQIMRKTIIDGSNTSGFQRTVLIAHDGWIKTSQGKVGIETIALEEDAARIISKQKNKKTFRLDRLGIHLVEVTTKPDLKTPEQNKEAALKIGEILRACKVKRGIGTIRQDLNISTKNHPRVEIKGFQNPKIMIKTIENEIKRQQEEVENYKQQGSEQAIKNKRTKFANQGLVRGASSQLKGEVRKTLPNAETEFLRPLPGAARMYPETDHPLLKISRQQINNAKNNLPKLTSEHRRYLKQFGLNEELIKLILKQKKLQDLEYLIKIYNNPQLVAKTLTLFNKDLEIETLAEILELINKNKISENDIKNVIEKISQGQTLAQATEKKEFEKQELENEIKNLIKEKPNLSQGAYMGLLMQKFKGKVSGKEIAEQLEKFLK